MEESTPQPPSLWFSYRGVIVYLCLLCNLCLYLCRTCISVAIVYMYKDQQIQGILLSAFYVGYTISQIPGGWLASKYGAKSVLSLAVLLWSLVTILTVVFGTIPWILFILRLLVGLAEGVNYPCQMALNVAWSPHHERSTTWTFGVAGESAGTILALIGGPYLIHEYDSWKSVFIVSGGVGLIWLFLFLILSSSKPEYHKFISKAELNYILKYRQEDDDDNNTTTTITKRDTVSSASIHNNNNNNNIDSSAVYVSLNGMVDDNDNRIVNDDNDQLNNDKTSENGVVSINNKLRIPWRKIICNRPFQMCVIAHMCYNYGYYVVLSWIADFFKTEFNANYSKMGFVSMLPYALLMFSSPGAGVLADYLERKGFSTLSMRRIINTFAMVGASIGFIIVGFIAKSSITAEEKKNNLYLAATVLAITMATGGFMLGGVWSNFRDLSAKHAPILCGISNSMASLPGIVGQSLTGAILKSSNNNWFIIFALASGIEMFGAFIFLFGADAKDQQFDADGD